MKVNEIGVPRGATRDTKRRGRGSGSGHGKTSCRGHKGAKARSGVTTRPGFEGGQMQLIRRLPKRGFNPLVRDEYQVVNVESLNRFPANAVVGPSELKAAGLVTSTKRQIKVLGDGELTKIVTVRAHAISKSAGKKMDIAGAKFELIVASRVEERRGRRRVQRLAEQARLRALEAKRRAEEPQQKDQGQQQKGKESKQKIRETTPKVKEPKPKPQEASPKAHEGKSPRPAGPEAQPRP